MKARYFAVMFIVLALFLSSGCGGSSGGDVRINSNTNTNTITSQDQTGDNTGDNTNNDTGTITSNDQPPTPPTTSGDQTGNDTGNTTSNDQSGNTDTNTNTNTNNNTGNTSLTFDSTSYTTGTANGVTYRAYSNITYVASPVNESYQQLSIYIPETYISGGTLNGYTASTAPIFMANGSAGYSAAGISTPDRSTSAGAALAKGYVVKRNCSRVHRRLQSSSKIHQVQRFKASCGKCRQDNLLRNKCGRRNLFTSRRNRKFTRL